MSIESIADRATFLSRTDYGSVIAGKGDLVVELMSGRLTPMLRHNTCVHRRSEVARRSSAGKGVSRRSSSGRGSVATKWL